MLVDPCGACTLEERVLGRSVDMKELENFPRAARSGYEVGVISTDQYFKNCSNFATAYCVDRKIY